MRNLVIGYGNSLRCDDGVGPRIAGTVASWSLPEVQAIAVTQLVPELAVELSQADGVLFVDASIDAACDPFRVRGIEAARWNSGIGHFAGPETLLTMARLIGNQQPQAWLLTLASSDLGFGTDLSPAMCVRMAAALQWIERWLR